MRPYVFKIINWAPRVLGVMFSLFIALFAIDVFSEGYSLVEALGDFFIHLLPAMIIFAFTVIGWYWPGYGAMLWFISGTGFVLFFDNPWQVDIILSAPQFLVAILFLLSKKFKNNK